MAQLSARCALALCAACSRPEVRTAADFHPGSLLAAVVVVFPPAISNELGDERTGIVLSDLSRRAATQHFCAHAAQDRDEGRIVCAAHAQNGKVEAAAIVEQRLARALPIGVDSWRPIRRSTNADYALLFRPESVESAQQVSRDYEFVNLGRGQAGTHNLSCKRTLQCYATENETKKTYTISAFLIDMRTGKVVRSGLYSDSASRTVPRNLGFAEAPDAEPLLTDILTELGMAMLAN